MASNAFSSKAFNKFIGTNNKWRSTHAESAVPEILLNGNASIKKVRKAKKKSVHKAG